MRILMLFLALLLTWLPDGTPVQSPSLDRDWVCWENGVDMDEDEAILRTPQRLQERSGPAPSPIHAASSPQEMREIRLEPLPICFERQWLMTCRLRL